MQYQDPINKGKAGFPLTDSDLTVTVEYSGGDPIYVGRAKPGTAKSSTGWQIMKLTWSGSDLTDVKWAESTNKFIHEWDERAGYSYG